jgi:hypothetical protein
MQPHTDAKRQRLLENVTNRYQGTTLNRLFKAAVSHQREYEEEGKVEKRIGGGEGSFYIQFR